MDRIPDDELISAYLDDELSADERRRAEELLVERADLRRLFEELKSLRAGMKALPAYRLGDDFGADVLRRAERETSATRGGSQAAATEIAPPTSGGSSAGTVDLPTVPRSRLRPLIWSICAVAAALVVMFVERGRQNEPERVAQAPQPVANPAPAASAVLEDTPEALREARRNEDAGRRLEKSSAGTLALKGAPTAAASADGARIAGSGNAVEGVNGGTTRMIQPPAAPMIAAPSPAAPASGPATPASGPGALAGRPVPMAPAAAVPAVVVPPPAAIAGATPALVAAPMSKAGTGGGGAFGTGGVPSNDTVPSNNTATSQAALGLGMQAAKQQEGLESSAIILQNDQSRARQLVDNYNAAANSGAVARGDVAIRPAMIDRLNRQQLEQNDKVVIVTGDLDSPEALHRGFEQLLVSNGIALVATPADTYDTVVAEPRGGNQPAPTAAPTAVPQSSVPQSSVPQTVATATSPASTQPAGPLQFSGALGTTAAGMVMPQRDLQRRMAESESVSTDDMFYCGYYVIANGPQLEATLAAMCDNKSDFLSVTVEPAPQSPRQQNWSAYNRRGEVLEAAKPKEMPGLQAASPTAQVGTAAKSKAVDQSGAAVEDGRRSQMPSLSAGLPASRAYGLSQNGALPGADLNRPLGNAAPGVMTYTGGTAVSGGQAVVTTDESQRRAAEAKAGGKADSGAMAAGRGADDKPNEGRPKAATSETANTPSTATQSTATQSTTSQPTPSQPAGVSGKLPSSVGSISPVAPQQVGSMQMQLEAGGEADYHEALFIFRVRNPRGATSTGNLAADQMPAEAKPGEKASSTATSQSPALPPASVTSPASATPPVSKSAGEPMPTTTPPAKKGG